MSQSKDEKDGTGDAESDQNGNGDHGGHARGAPIQVPTRVDEQGFPLGEVLDRLKRVIREECGGDLCVTIRVEARNVEGFTTCTFVRTEPSQGEFVPRRSTIVVVSGAEPCGDVAPSESSEAPVETATPADEESPE